MKNKSEWIGWNLLRDFAAEGTDAHRLATTEAGWVERFGPDVLISYKHEPIRGRLTNELDEWCGQAGFGYERIFARFLPRKNAERQTPRLLFANRERPLQSRVTERHLSFGIDFSAGYSVQVTESMEEMIPSDILGKLPNLQYFASVSGGRLIKGRFPILNPDFDAPHNAKEAP